MEEKLANNKVLQALNTFGQKLGSNKFVAALQAGMMGTVAILMVGSVFAIVSALGVNFGWFTSEDMVYQILYLPYHYTTDLISLWVGALIAYNYARALNLRSPLVSAISSVIIFAIVAGGFVVTDEAGTNSVNMAFLGSGGMFVAFIVVWAYCNIERICVEKNITIKLPDVVPPSLAASFNSILPMLLGVILIEGVNVALLAATGFQVSLPIAIIALLSAPLGAVNSVPGIILVMVFACILWIFGIHGTMIIYSVLMAPMIEAITNNATAYATGGVEALAFYPILLFGCIQMCGGTGNTLPMAIFGWNSKSEQVKAVSRIAAVPGWFGINEPMAFGYPIMYNFVLAVPYICSAVVLALLTWGAYSIGFLTPAFNYVGAALPMGFGGLLGALSWKNFVWDYIMLAVDCVIWFPFFKVFERQCIVREAAFAEEE